MSNPSDFIIENGVLTKYVGQDPLLVFPDGITRIEDFALARPSTVKEIVFPASLEKIEDYALGDCYNLKKITFLGSDLELTAAVFGGCTNIKEIKFPDDFFSTKKRRPAKLIPFVKELRTEDMAYLWIFQDPKWISVVQQKASDANELALKMIDIIPQIEKFTPKILERFVAFIDWAYPEITCENVQAMSATIALKDEKIQKKFLNNEAVINALKSERQIEETEPIEELVLSLIRKNPLRAEATAFTKGINYAGKSKICSPLLLNYLVGEYLDFYDEHHVAYSGFSGVSHRLKLKNDVKIPAFPEQIAASLDREELSQALEDLVSSFSKGYRFWMYAYARFATEESLRKLMHHHPSGSTSKVRSWKESFEEALFLSETKAAVEYLEKKGRLEEYAQIRGMTLQEFCDHHSLPKWTMDQFGRIQGVGKYAYEITEDFKLNIYDTAAQKNVRSISAKAEPDAADEFKTLKKEAADFYKKRTDYIRKIYITAEQIDGQHWQKTYVEKAVLRPITEKVIWSDAERTQFVFDEGILQTMDGQPYQPKEWVTVAHVLEMNAEQIKGWQDYLCKNGKKLIVEQVWEPIVSKVETECFVNAVISKEERNEFKRNLTRKAIVVKSEVNEGDFNHRSGQYVFSDTGMMLVGEKMKIEYQVNTETNETVFRKFYLHSRKLTREMNAIMFELNRATLKSGIRMDDVERVSAIINNIFTLAQITDFIKVAQEHNATNVLALLLEFKNANFPDFDPMAEFVLE